MKKVLALLLAAIMMFGLVACSQPEPKKPVPKPIVTGQDDNDKGDLVLDGYDEYVVAVVEGTGVTVNKITDIKGLRVGAAFDNDGQKIAEYYDANFVGFGGENDAFSELCGGTGLDCVIVKKVCAEEYANKAGSTVKIVLDPIVIE